MRDYMPRRDGELEEWALNFVDKLMKYSAVLGIPSDEIDGIKEALDVYSAALLLVKAGQRTAAGVAYKNSSKAGLVSKIRLMTRFRLQSPRVTPVMRVDFRMPPRDSVRTEHHEVLELAEVELGLRGIREIVVSFRVEGSASRAKPDGYAGVSLAWELLDEPPGAIRDLTRRRTATKSPYILSFDETERGRRVYVAAAWQNARGNLGSWSRVQNAVIP